MNRVTEKKIILFGDSVLFGAGSSHRGKGCGRVLRDMLRDNHVLIKARNKDTTREGLQRLAFDVLSDNTPADVIVLFGNNDCR